MGCPLLVGRKVELAANLPISAHHSVALIIEVGEEVGATPTVGLEQLDSGGYTLTLGKVIVKRATQIIMQLDILCEARNGSHGEGCKHK